MGGARRVGLWAALLCALATGSGGCAHLGKSTPVIPVVPNERQKSILGDYVIESPDLLQIDLLYAVPKPPYRIQPLDVLLINVAGLPEGEQIAGLYPVEPDGVVTFGGRSKSVKVAGMTLDEARIAIQKHLDGIWEKAKVVTVAVAEGRGVQLVRGQHLVRPDGKVSLGSYGSVVVAGYTVTEAKALIEEHLKQFLQSPEVVVNVIGYNSKVYYIIFDFGGAGQQIIRLPVTGNDTVLDAISQVNGLTAVSDPKNVWVARSAGPGEADQILPVDWHAMTRRGRSESNYQLLPNDRIFVKAYRMTTVDVVLARVLSPFERAFGFTLLGAAMYNGLLNAGGSGGSIGGIGGIGGF
ncbi:MAG: polysaccharide biosynthesis/export family protein [Planctomycetia bacterium]|nr:polysaccharide biosynthesis/export family protein [Planctomycetia bacterium]